MNDIRMAYGTLKEPVSLSPRAETNIRLVSLLDNRKIPEWWVKHLKRHESTEVRLTGRVLVDLKVTTISIPFEQIFTVKTDIIERMCVKEPREIEIPTPIRPIKLILKSVTSLWGKITSERTEIIHKIVKYNPNPIPIPRMEYRIVANGVLIGKGTLYGPGMLKPLSEETIWLTTVINNYMLDEWWVSHIKNGEKTEVLIKMWAVIKVGRMEFRFLLVDMRMTFTTNLLGRRGGIFYPHSTSTLLSACCLQL